MKTGRLLLWWCLALKRNDQPFVASFMNPLVRPHHHKRLPVSLFVPNVASDDTQMDDATLLETVPMEQFISLCESCHLSTQGSKADLLARLRGHAQELAQQETQRIMDRRHRVEAASHDTSTKERYEIVDTNQNSHTEEIMDEEGFFYFDDPSIATPPKETATKQTVSKTARNVPPTAPPPLQNKEGERVVTIYNTKNTNDLTGVAAAQPGQQLMDPLNDVMGSAGLDQPWDAASQQTSETTNHELETAKQVVTELVATLLSMTGAPAFSQLMDGDDDDTDNHGVPAVYNDGLSFEEFNPAKVPTDLLSRSSNAIRAGRGQVLQDVLRQFELQAIGQDGMHGDDMENGGGHYRQVTKVRAFLEGYRRAQVRRLSRETTTLLLDKLVQEGVEGLDLLLQTMVRSSDDTGDAAGILNDSLIEFLNDAIRQQEQKVQRKASSQLQHERQKLEASVQAEDDGASLEQFWNITIQDGDRVETIDPNDPQVRAALQDELNRSRQRPVATVPQGAPQQILLLLRLLRQRLQAEASFCPDEKGRNLRLLAYCLRLSHHGDDKNNDNQIEQLLLKDIGHSLDRLDSFLELVASSIEYGESTVYELQPGGRQQQLHTPVSLFHVPSLRTIHECATRLRERQSFKALGLNP